MTAPTHHWNSIFSAKADSELGWYEGDVSQTLKFLELIPALDDATVFLPGAGTSLLVDALLERCRHLILNDISDEALKKLRQRIGAQEGRVTWLCHDISKPLPANLPKADLWIDRAVLHFLLSEEAIQGYFDNLRATLAPDGHVLLAEFATDGAPKCAGLDLHRYSVAEMTARLGAGFALLMDEHYTFINPFGDPRPYVYGLYQRG